MKYNIPDGIYFIYPFGSGWTAAKANSGRIVDITEQHLADTHDKADDVWAGIRPQADREVDVTEECSREILAAMNDVNPVDVSYYMMTLHVITRFIETPF